MSASGRPASIRKGLLWALLATTVSVACGAIGLAVASGEQQISATSYRTEFIDPGWWWASVLSLVPVGFAARASLWTGLAATVGATAGSAWAMTVTVHRYQRSGWGSGLELLGYLECIGLALAGVAVTVFVALATRRSRAR